MPKAKVIVIEDEVFAAIQLNSLVESIGLISGGFFHSGEEFLKSTDWGFDLAIVDIFLDGELTGLDVAAELKKRNKPFIFLTANQDERTLENAARLQPNGYLTKPFNVNDVKAALKTVSYSIPEAIEIQAQGGKEYLSPSDIQFIKSDGAYIEIQTQKGSVVQRKLLGEFVESLPNNFVRVHRSYVVNLDYVTGKSAQFLLLGEFQIPVSRSYKGNVDGITGGA